MEAEHNFKQKIPLPFRARCRVLAFGSQGKNTLCFLQKNFAYLSRLHPDLRCPQDYLHFQEDVRALVKKNPQILACDLHPDYQSTKFAQSLQPAACSLQLIQHHHAHIAACMAENGLKNQKVIGVAFDGTGLGSDNQLWGAEFLICDYKNFLRKAHLKEIPLLGAEAAILEPWRLSAAWLFEAGKKDFASRVKFIPEFKLSNWRILEKMARSGFNSPPASSMGRLFDAAACLILGKAKAVFEAQLAQELEKCAARYPGKSEAYNFSLRNSKGRLIIDPGRMFAEMITDLKQNQPKEKIAYRFHRTVAQMAVKTCLHLRKASLINRVVLTGGVFQNKLLLSLTLDLLCKEGFQALTHCRLTSNDAAISLGQAVIAAFNKEKGKCV